MKGIVLDLVAARLIKNSVCSRIINAIRYSPMLRLNAFDYLYLVSQI